VCEFTLRVGFSGKAWDWLGQFVGDDVFVKFVAGEPGVPQADGDDGTELDDGENDESDEEGELDPDNETEAGEEPTLSLVHSKSGPSDLAAYHEKQLDQEQRRPRGRPKGSTKNRVDPLTVNEATAF
jgi:hypothetical protein